MAAVSLTCRWLCPDSRSSKRFYRPFIKRHTTTLLRPDRILLCNACVCMMAFRLPQYCPPGSRSQTSCQKISRDCML